MNYFKKIFTLSIIALTGFMAFGVGSAFASTGDNVSGFAYGSNPGVGYISFNCIDVSCTAAPGGGGAGGDLGMAPTYEDYVALNSYINTGRYEASSTDSVFYRLANMNTFNMVASLFVPNKVMADVVADIYNSYGVTVDPSTGYMSGYAWSDHLGWISFEEGTGCPSGACAPKVALATGEITGWARAINHADDWDGWISLSCKNGGLFSCSGLFGSDYGLDADLYATGVVSGYAWGSDVIGWIKFSGPGYSVVIDIDQPLVDLTASAASTCTDPVELTWSALGATSCTMTSTNGLNETVPVSSDLLTDPYLVYPTSPSTTYTISCTDGVTDSLYQDSVTIPIACEGDLILQAVPSPVFAGTGYKTTLTWFSPSGATFSSCDGSSYQSLVPLIPTPPPPQMYDMATLSGLNAANSYTASLANVFVPLNPTHFKIACTQVGTGTVFEAFTSVSRGTVATSCDFTAATVDDGDVSLSWTSSGAATASATASPFVAGWNGPKSTSGSATVGFTSPETVYTLNVTSTDGSTNSCSATVNSDCDADANPNDPNGTDGDCTPASVTLSASPTVLPFGGGTTTLSWTTTNTTGGTAASLPSSSFGPVNCELDGGSENVSITSSTAFSLSCEDAATGDDITAFAYVGVGIAYCVPAEDHPECFPCPEGIDSPECKAGPVKIIEN